MSAFVIEELVGRFGACWDESQSRQDSDADASCLIFDEMANLVDCVFFGKLAAGDFCIHSGDNRTGSAAGDDETIAVHLDRAPPQVKAFVFVVTCYSGTLPKSSKFSVYNGSKPGFSLSTKTANTSAVVVGVIAQGQTGAWEAKQIGEFTAGRHALDLFDDAKKALKGYIADAMIKEGSNQLQNVSLTKGERFYLQPGTPSINFGVGWDIEGGRIDVDASVLAFTDEGVLEETVYFGTLATSNGSIIHSGDNRTGAGSGDDEVIKIIFDKLNPKVTKLMFVVNVYSNGASFANVAGGYARLFFGPTEFTRYSLTGRELVATNAIAIGKLSKLRTHSGAPSQWQFFALGEKMRGNSVTNSDVIADCKRIQDDAFQGPKNTLLITIIDGKDLIAKDSNGFSDPFVTVESGAGKKITKTKIIKKTLNPKWLHEFKLEGMANFKKEAKDFKFTCWDDDALGKDFMGSFTVDVLDIWKQLIAIGGSTFAERNIPLKAEKAKQQVSGSIKLRFWAL